MVYLYNTMDRSKFIAATPKKVLQHGEFIERIRKSLYYGMSSHVCSEDDIDADMEVSRPLAEYAADLFSEPHRGHSLNRLTRVAAGKSHATPCSLIMALIYLDRLNVIDPGYVRRITPQELFVVSLMISTKFYAGHDQQIYLEDWAKEGSMSEDKLKLMELEFLSAIDWNIYISNEQFFTKLTKLERTLAKREGLRRGWLTYGELMQLLPSFTLMKFLCNSITVLAVSYAASVMTIAGAFFLASQIPGTVLYRKPIVANAATTTTETTAATTLTAGNITAQPDKVTQATPIVTISPNDSVSITMQVNANCSALNVEAELLKLEEEYFTEIRLNQHEHERSKQGYFAGNDHAWNSYLQLPATKHDKETHYHAKADNAYKWLTVKAGYSDESNSLDNQCLLYFNEHLATYNANRFEDCLKKAQNVSVLRQLFNGVLAQTYHRLPEFWYKFI